MPHIDRRLVPGILLLVLGTLLILNNFGVIDAWSWADRYWPLLLIGVGILWAIDPNNRGLGVAAIIIGSLFELSRLGVLEINLYHLQLYWPLIVVAVGFNILIRHRARGGWVGGVIVLALGVIFQIQQLGWVNIAIWQLWPIVLIALGLSMLHKALERRKRPRY